MTVYKAEYAAPIGENRRGAFIGVRWAYGLTIVRCPESAPNALPVNT